jgi:mono/diheme cytochrome c family protein
MDRRWLSLIIVVVALLALAACGRVNLENLTPEAFKTAEAGKPTATVGAGAGTPNAAGTPASGVQGNTANGSVLYGTWCTGCHDTGRLGAPIIKGKTYDLPTQLPMLRGDASNTKTHPKYGVTELNDTQLQDILAYLATAQ